MGTHVKGINIPTTERSTDINEAFASLTNAFNTKMITREEYRAKIAALVKNQEPNDKAPRVIDFIMARGRER